MELAPPGEIGSYTSFRIWRPRTGQDSNDRACHWLWQFESGTVSAMTKDKAHNESVVEAVKSGQKKGLFSWTKPLKRDGVVTTDNQFSYPPFLKIVGGLAETLVGGYTMKKIDGDAGTVAGYLCGSGVVESTIATELSRQSTKSGGVAEHVSYSLFDIIYGRSGLDDAFRKNVVRCYSVISASLRLFDWSEIPGSKKRFWSIYASAQSQQKKTRSNILGTIRVDVAQNPGQVAAKLAEASRKIAPLDPAGAYSALGRKIPYEVAVAAHEDWKETGRLSAATVAKIEELGIAEPPKQHESGPMAESVRKLLEMMKARRGIRDGEKQTVRAADKA